MSQAAEARVKPRGTVRTMRQRQLPADPALRARIKKWEPLALQPARERVCPPTMLDDLDMLAFDHIGDPIAENFIEAVDAAGLKRMDILEALDSLVAQEDPDALAFWTQVNFVPAYLDFDLMAPAVGFGRRNLAGLIAGVHASLPLSYTDENVARVLAFTSRLTDSGDAERRLWETFSGILTSWDVEGLRPGGDAWKTWVRIRLMHTRVRMGIIRSGRWDWSTGGPISQVGTAGGHFLFADFRTNVIVALGGHCTPEERVATARVWQWITHLMGAMPELLGPTMADQRILEHKLFAILYESGPTTRMLTENLINGFTRARFFRVLPRGFHEALGRYAMHEALKDYQALEGREIADQVGFPRRRGWERVVAALAAGNRIVSLSHRVPATRRLMEKQGELAHLLVRKGLEGHAATYTTPLH